MAALGFIPGLGCGCPKIQVSAHMAADSGAEMAGWHEFGSLSSPAVFYKDYSTSGPGWSWKRTQTGHADYTGNVSPNGDPGWSWDGTTGLPEPEFPTEDGLQDWTGTEANPFVSGNPNGSAGSGGPIGGLMGYETSALFGYPIYDVPSASGLDPDSIALPSFGFAKTFTIDSKTSLTVSVASDSHASPDYPFLSSTDYINAGSFTITLSNPDSEDDAITRLKASVPGFDLGPFDWDPDYAFSFVHLYTLWEIRDAGAVFGYYEGTYQVHGAQVMPGVLYHIVVVWERRTAAVGEFFGDDSAYGSTWSASHTDTVDVRAGMDCTLATDALDMPLTRGYQTRIKSISMTPIDG